MKIVSRRSVWWPFIVVLVASSGLVVVGLIGLWQAARGARSAARAEATRGALLTAQSMRQSLIDRRILDSIDLDRCFTVVDGSLFVPPELGWVGTPPSDRSLDSLPWPFLGRISRARSAQARGESKSAFETYRAVLETLDAAGFEIASPLQRKIELAAAWSAQRAGLEQERDNLLDNIRMGSEEPDPDLATLAGAILLRVAAGQDSSGEILALAPRLPLDRGMALLRRVEELAVARNHDLAATIAEATKRLTGAEIASLRIGLLRRIGRDDGSTGRPEGGLGGGDTVRVLDLRDSRDQDAPCLVAAPLGDVAGRSSVFRSEEAGLPEEPLLGSWATRNARRKRPGFGKN